MVESKQVVHIKFQIYIILEDSGGGLDQVPALQLHKDYAGVLRDCVN